MSTDAAALPILSFDRRPRACGGSSDCRQVWTPPSRFSGTGHQGDLGPGPQAVAPIPIHGDGGSTPAPANGKRKP